MTLGGCGSSSTALPAADASTTDANAGADGDAGTVVTSCSPGSYVTSSGVCTAWTTCQPGAYVAQAGTSTTNAASCTPCAVGSTSSPGATSCTGGGAGLPQQQAYVKASNTDGGDSFGASVALSADGSTLAVGATGESSGAAGVNGNQADNSASDSGAVYVFTR